jgi:hypothetical protein
MSTARLILWSPLNDDVAMVSIAVPPLSRVTVLAQCWCEHAGIDARVLAVIGALGRRDGSLDWGVWVRCDAQMDGYQRSSLSQVARCAPDQRDRRLASALVSVIRRSDGLEWIGFNPAWPEVIREWISNVLDARCDGDILPLRADATALVARGQVSGRHVFFTARPLPFCDPELCHVLRDHSPSTFPTTLAHDPKRGWWLTPDVGGLDAARYIDRDGNRAARLFDAIADVQVSTRESADLQRLSYCITRETLLAGVDRLCDDERASMAVEVDRLWSDVGAEDAPAGWVHPDPSPDNIRVESNGGLVFLDLEDPWYGPIPLMGALAIQSIRRRSRWTDDERRRTFSVAWQRYMAACGVTHHAFDAWLRLAQLVRLIRRVERSATASPLLLEEEVPRRSWAIQSELRRLCGE